MQKYGLKGTTLLIYWPGFKRCLLIIALRNKVELGSNFLPLTVDNQEDIEIE
jgi:hypothetical protein